MSKSTGLIYSLVSRGTIVLAEHSAQGAYGNFIPVSRTILERLPPAKEPRSYEYDKFVQSNSSNSIDF